MIHEYSDNWKFLYTINEYGYKGAPVPISNTYFKGNIIILGDSYAFGQGVNDEDVFSTIIFKQLEPDFNVINLSVGGWGLSQQIRRYYEFGQLYNPKYVILQFGRDDPADNFIYQITDCVDGRFTFKNRNRFTGLKNILKLPIFQKSHLYHSIHLPLTRYLDSKKLEEWNLHKTQMMRFLIFNHIITFYWNVCKRFKQSWN